MQRKLSQGTVAARSGLSASYISMVERGGRAPTLGTLAALAKALHPAREAVREALLGPSLAHAAVELLTPHRSTGGLA